MKYKSKGLRVQYVCSWLVLPVKERESYMVSCIELFNYD